MIQRIALAIFVAIALAAPAHADGDAAKGEQVFKKCRACHQIGENAKNTVGPVLNDVVGRTAGTVEGFKYSTAMTEAGAGGLVWTNETLAGYLANPREFVPKNKMAFAGVKKPDELANVIAYLDQFSDQ